jgi:hypothetical protein
MRNTLEDRNVVLEKARQTESVKNEELQRMERERNILHTVIRSTANCIGNILRGDCLLIHVIEVKMEEMERRGGGRKQLLETIIHKKLKEEALYRSLWRTCFGSTTVLIVNLL